MNLTEIFKVQIEKGTTEMFLYGVEMPDQGHMQQVASIRWHKGALDNFPANLEFVRMMGENTSTPLFREV